VPPGTLQWSKDAESRRWLVRKVESSARWHMFDEKPEAVMAIERAVLPLMPAAAQQRKP
jgi:hypothetical protein